MTTLPSQVSRGDEYLVQPTERLLLVSNDAHVSAPLDDYRPYCPAKYREDLDDFAQATAQQGGPTSFPPHTFDPDAVVAMQAQAEKNVHHDPHEAIRTMDEDGVAVEVLFHGSRVDRPFPFMAGLRGLDNVGKDARAAELAAAGMRMYNRWLADYCSVEPGRHLGMAHVPMWDIDLAVSELEFAREAGLRGINFPAPRAALPDYNELVWEPFWSACESLGMSLNTHVGAASTFDVAKYTGVDGVRVLIHEQGEFSRRALSFMLLGGVFERHPNLRLIFTEQPTEWIVITLRNLDGLCLWRRMPSTLPKKPSEYFRTNCFLGASFMSNHDAQAAVANGYQENILWGRDFPHIEGTWPFTQLSLRKTLEGIPLEAARQMLGTNAVRAYGLDLAEVQAIRDRIGPTVEELTTPLPREEIPPEAKFTQAFREESHWN